MHNETPESWFHAVEAADWRSQSIRRVLRHGSLHQALDLWSLLAQWFCEIERSIFPADECTPERSAYADVIASVVDTGKDIKLAVANHSIEKRRVEFAASAYLREENFSAHVDFFETLQHSLAPLDPGMRAKLDEFFGTSRPPENDPFPGDEWKLGA